MKGKIVLVFPNVLIEKMSHMYNSSFSCVSTGYILVLNSRQTIIWISIRKSTKMKQLITCYICVRVCVYVCVCVRGWALNITGLGPKPHYMLCDLVPILGSLVSTWMPQGLIWAQELEWDRASLNTSSKPPQSLLTWSGALLLGDTLHSDAR